MQPDSGSRRACVAALITVGAVLGGLLIGYGPVGGDPDRLYLPIKTELARALRDGQLPFWSDQFGLGVPLVAEGHVAAFYPPNWLLYRLFDVATAYRLAMWLSCVALAGATFAYARRLGLTAWGAALAALAFALCGFQAIHASHEPFYSSLPLFVLALYFTERYIADRRLSSLGWLALTFGAQLTLGHFQIQMWTAGIVLVTASWRSGQNSSFRGMLGVVAALACGSGIAAVQLVLSWDLATVVGSTRRSVEELMFYSYPPAHWAELAIPRLFQGLGGGPEDPYWFAQGTTGYEACLYLGTIPLILAFVGIAGGREKALAPWRWLVPLSFALATMPGWWPGAYAALLHVPGLGLFRAPGRYTLITSLGLALLAGRGFDRAISARRFVTGLAVAAAFGVAAAAWALHWAQRPDYRAALGYADLRTFLVLAGAVWIASFATLLAWRSKRIPSAVPFFMTALELGILYFNATTVWGPPIDLPGQSPVLRQLAAEARVGTVAGALDDLPVRAGRSPTFPYLGMRLAPPNSAFEFARDPGISSSPAAAQVLRHFGVTHGVWNAPVPDAEVLYAGRDDVLDRLVHKDPGTAEHLTWYLVRYPGAQADAHVALRALEAADLRSVFIQLAQAGASDAAWFLPPNRPGDAGSSRAQSARIVRWNRDGGEVEHDGTCDLVILRTYVPGWRARLDGGPAVPVVPVDGGLQSVRLVGSGRTSVVLEYEPPHLRSAVVVSLISLGAALIVIGLDIRQRARYRRTGNGSAAGDRLISLSSVNPVKRRT